MMTSPLASIKSSPNSNGSGSIPTVLSAITITNHQIGTDDLYTSSAETVYS